MEFLINPLSIAFILLAIVYVLGRKYIEMNEKRIRPISDEESLSILALIRTCSEHDLFLSAAETWRISPAQAEYDFKNYLIYGNLPHYVRDLIRNNRSLIEAKKNDDITPGGHLPAAWSA
jgi:hypothetical protein